MSKNYLPRSDGEFLAWADNFATQAEAVGASLGLSIGQVDQYRREQAAFALALRLATDPATDGRRTRFQKREARRSLEQLSQTLAGLIRGNPSAGDDDRLRFGLTPRRAPRGRTGPPRRAPYLRIVGRGDGGLTLALVDAERPDSRARPPGTVGAILVRSVGDGVNGWVYERLTTDLRPTLLPPIAATIGTPLRYRAAWVSQRGEESPWSTPITTTMDVAMEAWLGIPGSTDHRAAA